MKLLLNKNYWSAIFFLTKANLDRQYRNSFIGWSWTILQPLSQVIIYHYVFSYIMRFPIENYIVYIITGIVPWTFISSSILGSCGSLLNRAGIITKSVLPKSMFPVSDLFRNFYILVVSMLLILPLPVLLTGVFSLKLLYFPLTLLPILIAMAACSIIFAYLTPYVRDLSEVSNVFLNVMFWLTPIVYPIEAFPEKYQWVFNYNPLYWLIVPFRRILHENRMPDQTDYIGLFLSIILFILIAFCVHYFTRKKVILYI